MSSASSDLTNIKSDIDLLTTIPDMPVRSLVNGSAEDKAYQNLIQAMDLLHSTPSYEKITQYIKSKLRPKVLVPGTLGAFIFGCMRADNDVANPLCSPLCLNGMPDYNTGSCTFQTWVLRQGKLTKINDNNDPTAKIYVYDDITNMTINDLRNILINGKQSLVSNGVTHVTLINGTDPYQELYDFDISGADATAAVNGDNIVVNPIPPVVKSTGTSFWTWLLIILIIIALIAIGYYIFTKARKQPVVVVQ